MTDVLTLRAALMMAVCLGCFCFQDSQPAWGDTPAEWWIAPSASQTEAAASRQSTRGENVSEACDCQSRFEAYFGRGEMTGDCFVSLRDRFHGDCPGHAASYRIGSSMPTEIFSWQDPEPRIWHFFSDLCRFDRGFDPIRDASRQRFLHAFSAANGFSLRPSEAINGWVLLDGHVRRTWLKHIAARHPHHETVRTLLLHGQYEDAFGVCENILEQRTTTPEDLATAALVLMVYEPSRLGTRVHDLLEDHRIAFLSTTIDSPRRPLATRVCDVVAGAAWTSWGSDPRTEGQLDVRADRWYGYDPSSLGFRRAESRTSALRRLRRHMDQRDQPSSPQYR